VLSPVGRGPLLVTSLTWHCERNHSMRVVPSGQWNTSGGNVARWNIPPREVHLCRMTNATSSKC
jgi:hypothetical protein